MEVRAGAVAGTADEADHVALRDLLPTGDGDPALMPVGGREVTTVVEHDEVAVALFPAAVDDRSGRGGVNRRSVGDADVDALVHASPSPAERARDRPADRPDQPSRRRRRARPTAPLRLGGAN